MAEGLIDQPNHSPPRVGGAPKYCKRCHYPINGLELVGLCPECGHVYNVGNHATFTYDDRPIPRWKRVVRGRVGFVFLLLWLAAGYVSLPHLGLANLFVFPVWIVLSSYLILDLLYRLLRLPVGFSAGLVGLAIGVLLAGSAFGDIFFYPLMLVAAMFGGFGGICLVQAEISNLRES